ncbi:zinc finger protein 862-like, partial [Pieris rapae]|uniref:zinc finger protein 862-like n=1 Tax=Pieris rapae TaxID=64459 RepID=UPI001E27E3F6
FGTSFQKGTGGQKYSLLLDESTDVSVTKYLGVVIRYFSSDKNKVVSAFLALQPLESSDAVGIVAALVKCLDDHDLDLQNLIGFYNLPHLILIPCVCHSLQSAVTHASENTLPRNIEFLIRETYNWFSHSTKRQLEYKKVFELINCGETPLKVLRACDTRWLSIEPAIVRILSQWDELKLHFFLQPRTVVIQQKCYILCILTIKIVSTWSF